MNGHIRKLPNTPPDLGYFLKSQNGWVPMVRVSLDGSMGLMTGDQIVSACRAGHVVSTAPLNRKLNRSPWRRKS